MHLGLRSHAHNAQNTKTAMRHYTQEPTSLTDIINQKDEADLLYVPYLCITFLLS